MALKQKKPAYFETLKHRCAVGEMKDLEEFKRKLLVALEHVREHVPIVDQYFDNCKFSISNIFSDIDSGPENPWTSIVHSDFWVNNYLFSKDSEGQPLDVKFVDFQNYVFSHPLLDLVFFLGISLSEDVSDEDFDFLASLYHKTMIEKLKKLDCDVSPYASEEEFSVQFNAMGIVEYGHCFMMSKIVTYDAKKEDKMSGSEIENMMIAEVTSQIYYDKVQQLTTRWVKKGWL